MPTWVCRSHKACIRVNRQSACRLKHSDEAASWPGGFRVFERISKSKQYAFGFNGLANLTGFADPSNGLSVAVMVNQLSDRPVTTGAMLGEIFTELRLSPLKWPG